MLLTKIQAYNCPTYGGPCGAPECFMWLPITENMSEGICDNFGPQIQARIDREEQFLPENIEAHEKELQKLAAQFLIPKKFKTVKKPTAKKKKKKKKKK